MNEVYKIRKSTIESIADAIRAKAGTTELISPLDMAEEILSLQLGDIDFSAQTATADNVEEGYTFYNNYGLLDVGTGGGINFKVVGGTTHPENPTENTIWIYTNIPVGEWHVVHDEPTTRVDGSLLAAGDVWIMNEKLKDTTLNALKKNNIEVSIHTARQWNGSSWEVRDASIYKNSQWIVIPNILRVFPTEYTCNADNWQVSTNKGTVVISSVSMYLYGHSEGSTRKLLNYAVDFSKYRTLCIRIDRMTSDRTFDFRWRKVSDNSLVIDYPINELDQSLWVGTHEIDISAIDDECKLEFNFSNGGGGVITDIWFEA